MIIKQAINEVVLLTLSKCALQNHLDSPTGHHARLRGNDDKDVYRGTVRKLNNLSQLMILSVLLGANVVLAQPTSPEPVPVDPVLLEELDVLPMPEATGVSAEAHQAMASTLELPEELPMELFEDPEQVEPEPTFEALLTEEIQAPAELKALNAQVNARSDELKRMGDKLARLDAKQELVAARQEKIELREDRLSIKQVKLDLKREEVEANLTDEDLTADKRERLEEKLARVSEREARIDDSLARLDARDQALDEKVERLKQRLLDLEERLTVSADS